MTAGTPRVRDAVANLMSYAASVLVGILFTPYLVRQLGVDYFGLVPIATGVTQYMGVLTVAIQAAVGRNVIASLACGDHARANRFWSTAATMLTAVTILALPASLWMTRYAPLAFQVPQGAEDELVTLMMATLVTFFVTSFAGVFEVGVYSKSRFDLKAIILVGSTFARVALTVALFESTSPRLWHVGAGLCGGGIVQLVLSRLASRHSSPELQLDMCLFSREAMSDIYRLGSWVVVNHVGALLFLNANVIVVNVVLGPEASGEFGLVMTWVNLLVAVGSAVSGIFGPTLIAAFARDCGASSTGVTLSATRIVALVMALPIGLVSGFARPLMVAWQGESFGRLGLLLAVSVLGFSFTIGLQPLTSVFLAAGRVRLPGVVKLGIGALSVGLGYALAAGTPLGMFGPAVVSTVTLVLAALLFTAPYAAMVLGAPRWTFLSTCLRGGASASVVALTSVGLDVLVVPDGWIQLGACALAASCVVVPLGYRLALTETERSMLMSRLARRAQ